MEKEWKRNAASAWVEREKEHARKCGRVRKGWGKVGEGLGREKAVVSACVAATANVRRT